jgi:hypothetical protein
MDKQDGSKNLSRRDVLKLAGTAAAFCTSFGFLHSSQKTGVVQDKHFVQDKHIVQHKWEKAEIKWYDGATLLYAQAIPARVAKHLESDVEAVVEVKLFRSGQMLKNLGMIQGKH